ncbi:MAG: 16S rRNA processing protein RimM [Saprospiraceae bacterium]|nr:16S rRNA processing protein RimM [Saprospiraceae bacterium]
MEAFIEIGKIIKPHGVKGELKVSVEEAYWEDFNNTKAVFINTLGQKLPYFVKQIQDANNATILKLEDVNTKEMALTLSSMPMFMREEDITVEVEDFALAYAFLANYTIIDKTLGEIGKVEEIIELPQQEMAVVSYKNKEVLIPLNQYLIVEINEQAARLIMDLPAGLLEL